MKGKKEYIVLLLIIGLIGAYLYFQKSGEIHYSLPEPEKIDRESVTGLKITKDGSELSLVNEDGRWLILPQKFPADRAQVERMVDAAESVTLTALASESKNYAIYKLDEENRIRVEVYGGESILREMDIGKPAPSYRHTFVKLGNDHRVFHAEGNLRDIFDRTADDLRDRVVMAFDEEITELTLTGGEESMTIVRGYDPVSKAPDGEEEREQGHPAKWQTDEGVPVKADEIDEIIQTLRNLRCEGFVKDKAKKDLTSPSYTVSLKGLKTYSISFFEKEENRHTAVSSESEYPFLVSEWKAEKIIKDLKTLTGTEE
jgi:hypothetical protein